MQLRWAIFQQQQQLQQRGVKVKFDWFFKRCFVIRRWWLLILMLAHNAEKCGKKYNNLDISYCLCLKKGYKNNTNFIFLHFTVVHFTFDKKTYLGNKIEYIKFNKFGKIWRKAMFKTFTQLLFIFCHSLRSFLYNQKWSAPP